MSEEVVDKARKLVRTVLAMYSPEPEFSDDVFELLIEAILSQNTTARNAERAFRNLTSKFKLVPNYLARASVEEVAEAVKPAGMQYIRARNIVELSKVVVERFGGRLDFIKDLPTDVARKLLMELPGVGKKTADIVLLFYAKRPVMPVDTHIARICRRLGVSDGSYEQTRRILEEAIGGDYLLMARAHLALIEFGREICRARDPQCSNCPLLTLCPYARARASEDYRQCS
ncbi:MAG: endonuclease III [Thermoprotei archaeon]|nr:MAG: endonuclease III [Thermoprotei archaeon]